MRPARPGSSADTKIRSLTRIAFGFHGADPLIALALLALGNMGGTGACNTTLIIAQRHTQADMGGAYAGGKKS